MQQQTVILAETCTYYNLKYIIRMSVSLLLLNVPPLKLPYKIIRILVVGDVVRRTQYILVSGRESRDKWYGGQHAPLTQFVFLPVSLKTYPLKPISIISK